MKKLFKYFGLILSVALMGAFTACNPQAAEENAEVGLAIKVFSPTKVVAGSAMTINGSGFTDAKEIVFPGEVSVTSFKIVTDNMIRVTAPNGISEEGGKIIVRTDAEEAVSSVDLKLGKPTITGYSKQAGESITGGEQLTIYGSDLEFITSVEFKDEEGNPVVIKDNAFYRKGTSNVVIIVPKKIFEGTFAGKVSTQDGKTYTMPEYEYKKPVAGHWEIVKEIIWKNDDPDGIGPANWNGIYRFAPETNSTTEEIALIPTATWERMKTEKFYMMAKGSDWPQLRIVTGWWNNQWPDGTDIKPDAHEDMIIDNGDGTFYIELDLKGSDIAAAMDAEHLLFTGSGYTPLELYFQSEQWVGDGAPEVSEYDIAAFTVYEAEDVRNTNIEWPFHPSWSDKYGKARIMRGMGDPAIEDMGLTTNSKFVVYKEAGTKGQIQWNDANWKNDKLGISCNDWDGSAESIEVPFNEEMLKCISGETADTWGNTAFIIQGDGLTVTKIVLVP